MSKLERKHLMEVMKLADLDNRKVATILGHSIRRVQAWTTEDGWAPRNVPSGEVERLCLLLDPKGKRQDIIGWIVVAARGRTEV